VLALRMLDDLLKDRPITLETLPSPALFADGVRTLRERGCRIVCIADLPPSGPSKSRHLVKRLRAAVPELTILVGRWAPPPFEDESNVVLQEAGADHVATTLIKTREQLLALLAQVPGYAGAEQDDSAIRQVAGGERV